MTEDKPRPQLSQKGLSEAERRRQRQAEALRANLGRRKEQSRGRAETGVETAQAPAPEGGD